MKTFLIAAALLLGSSFAQAHGHSCDDRGGHTHRSGETTVALCQTIFSTAQDASYVCGVHGYQWTKAPTRDSYICDCGTFDPSAPGSVYERQ